MSESISLLIAQINPNIGSIKANCDKIIQVISAEQNTHDIIVFPELSLTGYLIEDLLYRDALFFQVNTALEIIAKSVQNCHVIVGHPARTNEKTFNRASIFSNGKCVNEYDKQKLPNYGIFDEKRYYQHGETNPCVFKVKDHNFKLCICEDLWQSSPEELLADNNTQTLIAINASPFEASKYDTRVELCSQYAKYGASVIYVNQVGGQDELVFDGQSFAINSQGEIKARAPAFKESLQSLTITNNQIKGKIEPLLDENALIYQALMCGLRDYVNKNNFKGVLLGLSGGIDSALTLAIAADALGPSRVFAALLPSQYTAEMSNQDAIKELENIGVSHYTLPIEDIFASMLKTLKPAFKNRPKDTTEENLQARIRGTLLMALSNKTGHMLLCTSNKSEAAVGYTTLYGDMTGGFAVIKDVLKTKVYELAKYRNQISPIIPERVITRAPSAELAHDQKDEDNLPKYSILDAIIKHYMEDNLDADKIIAKGFAKEDVLQVVKLIFQNEYKRRQGPPGIKISKSAFGKDWRRPLSAQFSL
ncbi:MAG: NAD+ synthase [Legionellaceae bacterium]|nr:NAD+ synthase [Legionellaceae bacterium]